MAVTDDAGLLLAWRNDSVSVAQSLHDRPVSLEEHRDWLARVLADDDRTLLVGEDERGPVGSIRFDVDDAEATVSVIVAPERRGEGLAVELIRAGTALCGHPVRALVRPGNVASARAFVRAGYVAEGDVDVDGTKMLLFVHG